MSRVLIVEDNRDIGVLYQRTFGRYETDLAASAYEAIGRLEQAAYDLIVLDMHLGEVSGLAVLEHLKQIDCTAPVFAISADDTLKYQALGLGASVWMTKPIEIDELLIAAMSHLNNQDGRAA